MSSVLQKIYNLFTSASYVWLKQISIRRTPVNGYFQICIFYCVLVNFSEKYSILAVIYLLSRKNSCKLWNQFKFSKNCSSVSYFFCLLEASFTSHFCTSSWMRIGKCWLYSQKQPSIGVPTKNCSENMQQIYRGKTMPKCDFNKVAKQFHNFKVLLYIAVLVFNLVWYFQCET